MAVSIFNNNISKAYTDGQPVYAIYSHGVKVWPNDEPIPEGYTLVDCVYSEGARIVMSIPLSDQTISKFKMIMDLDITTNVNNNIVGWNFGKPASSPSEIESHISNSKLFYGYYGGSGYNTGFNESDCGRGTMIFDLEKYKVTWNGPVRNIELSMIKDTGTQIRLFLFNPNAVAGYNSYNKIYKITIYSNGEEIMKLLPVLNDNTGYAGLYDIINDNFYYNTNLKYDPKNQ